MTSSATDELHAAAVYFAEGQRRLLRARADLAHGGGFLLGLTKIAHRMVVAVVALGRAQRSQRILR